MILAEVWAGPKQRRVLLSFHQTVAVCDEMCLSSEGHGQSEFVLLELRARFMSERLKRSQSVRL